MDTQGQQLQEQKPDMDYVLVDNEPSHRQRWKGETVRLVCVQFPPKHKCLWHQHNNYGIYVVMAPLNVSEQPYGKNPRPLVQDKGSVFCRDHTKDHLLHVIWTDETPLFIVEVELLKPKAEVVSHDHVALHAGKGIELLNDEPECRVYRFTLENDASSEQATTEIAVTLPTEAVLVVLDDCEVEITSVSDDKKELRKLKVADDVHVEAGKFVIKLVSSSAKKTQFVLSEVY